MKRIITLVILILVPFVAFAQRTRGTANAHLQGRNVVGSLPKPSSDTHLDGTVVVQVKVDQYGNVTEAIPGVSGTTLTDKGLWNAARSAAMKAHFNTKADAPVIQTGTITYEYSSSDDNSGMTDGASVRSWHLDGRNASQLPLPSYQCNGAGEVTIIITVNNQGTVVDAKIDESVSSQDGCLRSFATRAARLSKFNASSSAPSRQMGTITYVFPKSNRHQDDVIELRSLGYDHLRFKDVEITGNFRDFARKIEEKGCVITESSDMGVILHGPFMGYPDALIIVYPDAATKDVVSVGAFLRSSDNWSSMESSFYNTVETYKKKYGDPQEYSTEFADGLLDSEYFRKQFVEDEKCHYYAKWYFEEGGIDIEIKYLNHRYGVLILYFDSQNSQKREDNILNEI